MTNPKQCDFLLMRYVPDPFKNEFVNIGVLLLSRDDAFADARFTRDWTRVRCLDAHADLELLGDIEQDIRSELHRSAEARRQVVSRLQETLSTGLQLSEPSALLSASPEMDLNHLAKTYLERPRARGPAKLSARTRIATKMREAFESAGIWNALTKDIKAEKYTHRGDPLKIDCGYRPNGVVKLFHGVSLATNSDSAKVLAFTYPALAAGILRLENAKTELTALVEDNLDREDKEIGFAFETLERTSIQVASLSQMPAIAERARLELGL